MTQITLSDQVNPTAAQCTSRTRPTDAPHAKVAEAAGERFQASPYYALRSIVCEFHEGVLVLRGQVPSYYLKQLAQELVRDLDGIGVIVNVVDVQE